MAWRDVKWVGAKLDMSSIPFQTKWLKKIGILSRQRKRRIDAERHPAVSSTLVILPSNMLSVLLIWSRVSQPWSNHYLFRDQGCPVQYRMFTSIPGLYTRGASTPSPNFNNQKCLQTLPGATGLRTELLWLRTTDWSRIVVFKLWSHNPVVKMHIPMCIHSTLLILYTFWNIHTKQKLNGGASK